MLKQKIAQWHEYKDSKKDVKKQYAKFIECYKDWEHKEEIISVTQQKTNVSEVLQRPDDNLFGTQEYPCIVNHTCHRPFSNTSFIRPDALTESFPCKNYEKHSACLNKDCFWYPDNLVASVSWEQYQDAVSAFRKAKERYDNARRAFWGERFAHIFNK